MFVCTVHGSRTSRDCADDDEDEDIEETTNQVRVFVCGTFVNPRAANAHRNLSPSSQGARAARDDNDDQATAIISTQCRDIGVGAKA